MSESEKRKKMVEKIRGLFAKAAHTDNEIESQLFERKAADLLAKWEIDRREIQDTEVVTRQRYVIDGWGFATTGVLNTAGLIARKAHQVASGFSHWATPSYGGVLWLYCTDQEFEIIEIRLDFLLPQLRQDMITARPRSRKSFALAWGARVAGRLARLQEEAYSSSQALVPTMAQSSKAMNDDIGELVNESHDIDIESTLLGEYFGDRADVGNRRLE